MEKLLKNTEWREGLPDLYFYCPGCKCDHGVWVNPHSNGGAKWDWNGSLDKPTFTPSLLVRSGENTICHSFITDGRIGYLSDCTHELAGQNIEMVDAN
jgi:hypothetical protein